MGLDQKLFYIMVGLPGTGKTTYRKQLVERHPFRKWKVISIDDLVEEEAKQKGLTYDEVWKDLVGGASDEAMIAAQKAFRERYDVVWDATNLTTKSRASKLALVPSGYAKYAVVIEPPEEKEYARRLSSRPGKFISPAVIEDMRKRYESPKLLEGFDHVISQEMAD